MLDFFLSLDRGVNVGVSPAPLYSKPGLPMPRLISPLQRVLIFGTDGGGEGCQFCFPPTYSFYSVSFFFECSEFSLGRDSAPQSHRANKLSL